MHRPSRREILASAAALAASPRAAAGPGARDLVLVLATGGWDTTYSLDPKLGVAGVEGPEVDRRADAPEDVEAVETFGGIPIVVNDSRRPHLSAFFRAWHREVTVVNGVHNGAVGHVLARRRVLCGADDEGAIDLSVIHGLEHGADLPLAAIDLGGFQHAGPYASSVGHVARNDQLLALLDPDGHAPIPPAGVTYPRFVPSAEDEVAMADFLARRAALASARRGGSPRDDELLRGDAEAVVRAARLREVAPATDLAAHTRLVDRVDQALGLLDDGVTRSVFLDHRDFDSHEDTESQHSMHDGLFEGLSRLASGLSERGRLERTLVVVMSEMTRCPVRNVHGGKDHWPTTSYLVLGGGVPGDRVLGATDDLQQGLPVALETGERWDGGAVARYDQVLAGILLALDVDPARWLPGVPPWRGLVA